MKQRISRLLVLLFSIGLLCSLSVHATDDNRVAMEAYQKYISAYNEMAALMSAGKGDTPEGREVYKKYKHYEDLYKAATKTEVPQTDAPQTASSGVESDITDPGGESRPWVIGTDDGIYHGTGSGWEQQPGGGLGKDIAIAGSGLPWIIGSSFFDGIYYHDGLKWVEYPGGGGGLAIAIAPDGTPWAISTKGLIYYGTGSGWVEQPGGGIGNDIAIDGRGRPWVIGSTNGIHYHDGNRWVEYPGGGRGSAIAVSSDDTPWVIGSDGGIYRGTGSGWVEQPGGGKGKDIAIDERGRPWVIGTTNGVHYHDGTRWVEYPGGGRGSRLAVKTQASSSSASQVKATQARVRALSPAIDRFELDVMRYPTEQEGLKALLANPGLKDWYGPYVKEEKEIADAWGTPLKYLSPTGKEYRIISAGPDREFGTADDVGVDN